MTDFSTLFFRVVEFLDEKGYPFDSTFDSSKFKIECELTSEEINSVFELKKNAVRDFPELEFDLHIKLMEVHPVVSNNQEDDVMYYHLEIHGLVLSY